MNSKQKKIGRTFKLWSSLYKISSSGTLELPQEIKWYGFFFLRTLFIHDYFGGISEVTNDVIELFKTQWVNKEDNKSNNFI